ncbi:hypothetical protein [Loigolactobacillus backii]|uniref:hypothetical protein n=1 Tax=Loigolactobacillus backii TaxID=375175 RepID=UPI0007F0FE0F|nr:hypothetical protein [Loigolactobacillus backii]ANK67464.1 hypothetical protein AYR55_07005 [Loigolactobacillus backii]OLF70597.1 hypothetical protein ACX53_01450 [Loigolactobacillus backii]PIO88186.1 hypothetical protein B8A32_03725 [Loigolactobacillus backii]
MSKYYRITKLKPFFIIAIFSLLMLLPQIYQHSVIIGGDAIFHMNRFYDAAMQIKTGHYNYFLSNFGFQQSARIVNALYSPVIAYIAGLILLIANSWLKFELITSFFIFIISGLSMYLLETVKSFV